MTVFEIWIGVCLSIIAFYYLIALVRGTGVWRP
jgi:hypothetical protein